MFVTRKMVKGIVKWFNARKGFGFIVLEGSQGKDIFVHYSAIRGDADSFRTLHEGDCVQFETKQGRKGIEATNVVVEKPAPFKSAQKHVLVQHNHKRPKPLKKHFVDVIVLDHAKDKTTVIKNNPVPEKKHMKEIPDQ